MLFYFFKQNIIVITLKATSKPIYFLKFFPFITLKILAVPKFFFFIKKVTLAIRLNLAISVVDKHITSV